LNKEDVGRLMLILGTELTCNKMQLADTSIKTQIRNY